MKTMEIAGSLLSSKTKEAVVNGKVAGPLQVYPELNGRGFAVKVPTGPLYEVCPPTAGDLERVLFWARNEGIEWLVFNESGDNSDIPAGLTEYAPGEKAPRAIDIEGLADRIAAAPIVDIERFLNRQWRTINGRAEKLICEKLVASSKIELEGLLKQFPRVFDDKTPVIAIDFDGTLTLSSDSYPAIGAPNWAVIRGVIARQRQGACIVLWTCREGRHLEAAIEAAKNWGLTFDYVNENPKFRQRKYGTDPRKIGADEYWEDKAVHPDSICDEPRKAELKVLINEGGIFQGVYLSKEIADRYNICLELIDFVTDDNEELVAAQAAYESAKERAKKGELRVVWH